MKRILLATVAVGVAMAMLGSAIHLCSAQETQGPPTGDRPAMRRGGGMPGGFDPARMREMMMGRFKEQLAATDEEWTVIEPRLQKVTETRISISRLNWTEKALIAS